jgi:putative transposase
VTDPMWQRWAQFRFAVIGGLLSSPPLQGDLQTALRVLADKNYQHPIEPEKRVSLGLSTIERWYYKAREAQDPIAALGRKPRCDAGKRSALSPELFSELKIQYRNHAGWTAQLHYDNLSAFAEERPDFGKMPSYKSVLRLMQENGWARKHQPATQGQIRAVSRLETREVRSFEASHVHALWHLDFHHAKVKILDENGRWHNPLALAVCDDRSRLCCHLQFYLSETAECLVHGLTQAFMKRGLPRALMTDNGAAMLAEETRQGLARMGVTHETTLPYSPYQNGKQEVFWGQLEGRFLELLRCVGKLKLSILNQAAQAWVEQDYHRRTHRETAVSPLNRMLDEPSVARKAPDADTLRLAFTRHIRRSQRRSDATVVVDGIRYELPQRFARTPAVNLRYAGWDKSYMILVDPKTGTTLARLWPQDKAQNASGHRRLIEPGAALIPQKDDPMPSLLKKWLADYAATGLPPAYIPKEETEHE